MKQTVFVNRILNMKKIKFIGLDMDHTLIRYHTKNFEETVYKLVVERLILEKHYPCEIKSFQFDFDHAIRGLVVDCQHGNILKLSRFAAIRHSHHGTKPIEFIEQQRIYRSTYVDLRDPNYIAIDTAFSIAFCVLYAQLVDYKDQCPLSLPNYREIALDVLHTVDVIHADGSLKKIISENLDHYVIKEREVVEGLRRYVHFGKKLFILTNSEYLYAKLLLDYAINPFLPKNEHWCDLFEFVITSANKPRFFYDNLTFLKINPDDARMTNLSGKIVKGVYQGGNAKKFTDDLELNGDEILYIGAHIYGDILRLKKHCNWRTALVVDELGAEISSQQQALPTQEKITQAMQVKVGVEEQYTLWCSQRIEEDTNRYDELILDAQKKIALLDKEITQLLTEQHQWFNRYWDRVFRAGAEESYFAYQVEHYACIYMENLASFLQHSPLSYFRANRRPLAHDMDRDTI
jgi:HAD superfamily 5'-nucleotidase-like hydrolase